MTQIKLKDNQQVAPVVADDGMTVTFHVADGLDPIVLHMDRLSPEILRRAACVGMAQVRIIDAAAVPATDADGLIVPRAERLALKRERMSALVAHYETGTTKWNRRRARATGAGAGAGAGDGGAGLTILALMRVYGNTAEQAEATITRTMEKKGLDRKGALKLWASTDKVAAAIAEIKAERARAGASAANVDADALALEMMGEGE